MAENKTAAKTAKATKPAAKKPVADNDSHSF